MILQHGKMLGNSGDDKLEGTPQDDQITGGAGKDSIWGYEGSDTIDGGDGDDSLTGGGGDDTLAGGAGNDALYGDAGNDTLYGGDGNDTLTDGFGENLLEGGAGDDEIALFGNGSNLVDGGTGDDTIRGGSGNDTILGGEGNDEIQLTDYHSAFDAAHTVIVDAGAGHDRIVFGNTHAAASVSISGGTGTDSFVLSGNATAEVTIQDFKSGAGGDMLGFSQLYFTNAWLDGKFDPFASQSAWLQQSGEDTLVQIDLDGASGNAYGRVTVARLTGVSAKALTQDNFVERYNPNNLASTLFTTGDDRRVGTGADEYFMGLEGDDNLRGGAGNDKLEGGSGDDTLAGELGNDVLDGGFGNDSLTGGDGDDKLTDDWGSNVLDGGNGDDILVSLWNGKSAIYGGSGHDTIRGGNADTINGGAGSDTINVEIRTSGQVGNVFGGDGDDVFNILGLSDGSLQVSGGIGSDLFKAAYISGYALNLTITDFTAGAGGDILAVEGLVDRNWSGNPFGANGPLRIEQKGADTLFWNRSGEDEVLVLRLKNVRASALIRDNFVDKFDLNGSMVGETITGTAGDDVLAGTALDDKIHGAGGADVMNGYNGDDYLQGGTEVASDGADQVYGGGGNDTLLGGAGADLLEGGDGDDLLDGGTGDDTLRDYNGASTLRGGTGNDTIVMATDAGMKGEGGSGDDVFVIHGTGVRPGAIATADGGTGNDTFTINAPFGGNIRITGGTGTDFYAATFGSLPGAVTITDFVPGSSDKIDLGKLFDSWIHVPNPFGAAGYLYLTQVGNDAVIMADFDGPAGSEATMQTRLILTGVQASTLRATDFVSPFHDPQVSNKGIALVGGAAADTLTGQHLEDTLVGGAGDDMLFGEGANDSLDGGDGNDRLFGGWGFDTVMGGAGADQLDGGEGNDVLDGGDGDDTLIDERGDNILRGGVGNDTLSTGSMGGTQQLYGGLGADTFRLSAGSEALNVTAEGGDGIDAFELSAANASANFRLAGGAGIDTFTVASGFAGKIVIEDFAVNEVLDLRVLLQDRALLANPFSGIGYLELKQSGKDTLVQYDADGVFGKGAAVTLAVLRNVAATSLGGDNFRVGNPLGNAAGAKLAGSDIGDTLRGGADNDEIEAGNGNDVLIGAGGDDKLAGGSGIDTAVYYPGVGEHRWWQEGGGIKVVGRDGLDVLSGIERLHFSDADIALDIDGNAGKVYRLYQAAFDRTPDKVGLGFWISAVDQGASLNQVATGFIDSAEFRGLYGAAPSNAELVALLYQNVLHRAGEKGGVDFWLSVLDQKLASFAEVLAAFSESPENVESVAKVIGNGFDFTPWAG